MPIVKAASGVWCDYCKAQYGKDRYGQWNLKAQSPAWVTVVSELAKSKGQVRHYCRRCVDEIEQWPTGELFTLRAQVDYSHGIEVLHV